MKLLIQLVLWIIIIFLGYKLFNSVYEPTKFNNEKERRYAKVIDQLKDIRTAELAHLQVTGKFNSSFDSLSPVSDTAQFAITQRRDTSYADVERNRAFGLDPQTGGYYLEEIIVDTLRFVTVKDSLFKDSDRYKRLNIVKIGNIEAKIDLKAGIIKKSDLNVPVFEAKLEKAKLLTDQDPSLVAKERKVVSVDGINGEYILLGSMEEVSLSGNWPKKYGNNE